jgi:RNA polymerase sigma-70 factor, ECF subfamily
MSVQQQTGRLELSQLLSRSQRPLYAYIRGQVRSSADADDVYQETVAALWEHFDAFDPERPFINWACGVAWRKVITHHRNLRRLKFVASAETGSLLADKLAAAVARIDPRLDQLQDCLALLKPESRTMIRQHYYKGEEVDQIATRYGVSESTIYKTLARIRRALLDCIERKLKEER